MRKFILIAAMVLVSATAQAGGSRGLILASSDQPAATEQLKAAEQAAVEAPKYVERPAAVETKAEQPQAEQAKPAPEKNAETRKAGKPKRKPMSMEARVISELHRYGIYW